jgi:hypothetical protein
LPVTSSAIECLKIPKGFLPTLIYSTFFLIFPILDEYAAYDYTTTLVRVGVIAASVVAATLLVAANDCVAWFNMVLFFYIGVEVTVLDAIKSYADETGREDSEKVLAWLAFGAIIFHLVPFLVVDYEKLLIVLASVGVVTNAAALVIVEPARLLVASAASSALLLSVLLIACIECVQTSLLSQLKIALRVGFFKCLPYES